ncbi:lysophospholipase [bacterium]|nr:lysophospholipase [bacterium]
MRKKFLILLSLCLLGLLCSFIYSLFDEDLDEIRKTITFPSRDGVKITADTYIKYMPNSTPLIVLFHQEDWSRGEYAETAYTFVKNGFNCMAVDLRSGNHVNGVENQTMLQAKKAGKGTRYLDALRDVEAALSYSRVTFRNTKIIALGSSYSASLVLKVAGENPELLDGVMAFSPGEYFVEEGKPVTWIQDSARKIQLPVFITSARNEKFQWINIFQAINSQSKMSYLPIAQGYHGSRSLWSKHKDNEVHWKMMQTFIKSYF